VGNYFVKKHFGKKLKKDILT